MNYSTAILLVNDNVRAIKASYELDVHGNVIPAHVRTFKTLDADLCVGEFVVVPTDTRHKMTVCRVEEVDVDVDHDNSVQIEFIVGRVDTEAYQRVIKMEQAGIAAIRSAEKRKKRDVLRESLIKDNPDLSDLLNVSTDAALPAPKAPAADQDWGEG